jgi:endonuclease/exonuclease/phosphatase family metal-dependent hydrolase
VTRWKSKQRTSCRVGEVSFDPYQPYGPLVTTSCRVATWNVWGRFGDWQARQKGLISQVSSISPDILCLQESWETDTARQADLLGDALELPHRYSTADWSWDDWRSGATVLSRWPITRQEITRLNAGGDASGMVMFALLDGPRGPVQVFNVMLDYPLHASGVRQHQVRELASFVTSMHSRRHLTLLCGDFNAGPDSNEIRLLNGQSQPPVDGLVFYDAWQTAGDSGPGFTWDNANPLAAICLLPNQRLDYIFTAWPRRGGVGHPLDCQLLGDNPAAEVQISDHHGVYADLRY